MSRFLFNKSTKLHLNYKKQLDYHLSIFKVLFPNLLVIQPINFFFKVVNFEILGTKNFSNKILIFSKSKISETDQE